MRALLLMLAVAATFAAVLWLRQRPVPAIDPRQASLERIEVARARGQLDAATIERLHIEALPLREAGRAAESGIGDAAGSHDAQVGQ